MGFFSYVIAILVLGFLVFIHEVGHYSAAKLFKMPVKAFAMGLGPTVLKKKIGETEYRLSLLPLGGYVQIMGEDDKDLPYGFLSQAPWKRFIVLIAGVVMNFISAIVIFAILIAVFGNPVRGVQINGTLENSHAATFIQAGDQLLEVNGNKINDENYVNISKWTTSDEDKIIDLTVRRGSEVIPFSVPLTPYEGKEVIGISYTPKLMFVKGEDVKVNPITAPFKEFAEGAKTIFTGLKMIVTGQVTMEDIQGPVGIVKTTSEIAQSSVALLLYWTALLSINLGIMNLLPIPALDGGQILFLLGEKIVGKKWSHKVAYTINAVFMLALLGLMLFITYFDITRLFK